jgi:hypothetical protein
MLDQALGYMGRNFFFGAYGIFVGYGNAALHDSISKYPEAIEKKFLSLITLPLERPIRNPQSTKGQVINSISGSVVELGFMEAFLFLVEEVLHFGAIPYNYFEPAPAFMVGYNAGYMLHEKRKKKPKEPADKLPLHKRALRAMPAFSRLTPQPIRMEPYYSNL